MQIRPVAVIGAGPAGFAAAIQLKRYGLETLVLERQRLGGLLHNANLVENYPGFPEGIPGSELVRLFEKHTDNLTININDEEVTDLFRFDSQFRALVEDVGDVLIVGFPVAGYGFQGHFLHFALDLCYDFGPVFR